MTHDDLPDPPPNTAWLAATDTIAATDFCVLRDVVTQVPLNIVGAAAGEPQLVSGGWYYFARNSGA